MADLVTAADHTRPAGSHAGDTTIIVDDVHMTYRVYEDRRPSVRGLVAAGLKPRPSRLIRAVQGVSFTACAGEVVGVIGANGSGKSTLLRGLAGLQPVDGGEIHAASVPVLLGVGAALNNALSGRRNIELGCLALGMSKDEMGRRFGKIVAFSGLEEFVDLPLKAYSSGMRARLHFSIATAVEPHILLIDEALATGDETFQERSAERIEELREHAGTVFVVSHSLKTIIEMCTRALWLERGNLMEDGEPKAVVNAYRAWLRQRKDEQSGL